MELFKSICLLAVLLKVLLCYFKFFVNFLEIPFSWAIYFPPSKIFTYCSALKLTPLLFIECEETRALNCISLGFR